MSFLRVAGPLPTLDAFHHSLEILVRHFQPLATSGMLNVALDEKGLADRVVDLL